jgi:hypothetical protein
MIIDSALDSLRLRTRAPQRQNAKVSLCEMRTLRSNSCKILCLLGAGASIPANVKSTPQLTQLLINAFKQDPFLRECKWLPSPWNVIKQHAKLSSFAMGPYEPNFEHLMYAIELLEDYTDVFRMHDNGYIDAIKELAKQAEIRGDDAYAAASYALLPLTLYARSINPISSQIMIKGSSAKFMWAARAIRRLLADQFPMRYSLNYLAPFADLFQESPEQVTIATTNYDLVFEQFATSNGISYDDGFNSNSQLGRWKGFPAREEAVTYLKLHGSLNWFQLKKEWLSAPPPDPSPNDIYKVENRTVKEFLSKIWRKRNLRIQNMNSSLIYLI